MEDLNKMLPKAYSFIKYEDKLEKERERSIWKVQWDYEVVFRRKEALWLVMASSRQYEASGHWEAR